MRIALSPISLSPVTSALNPFIRRATFPHGILRVQGIRKFYAIDHNRRIQRSLQLLYPVPKHSQSTAQEPNYISKSKMAALKRKQVPSISMSQSSVNKRPKNEVSPTERAPRAKQALETETDSDPIVESDTTENSGDDNGVSWPSDHASAAQDSSADEDAGVAISQDTSRKGSYVLPRMVRLAKKAGNGMISSSTHPRNLTSPSNKCLQGNPRQAKGPSPGAQSSQTQRRFSRPVEKVMGTITKKVSRATRRAEGAGRRIV